MAASRPKKFILDGLDCAVCAAKIEAEVQRETGLAHAGINFSTRSLYLPPEYVPTVQRIIDRIEPGVRLVEPGEGGAGAGPSHSHGHGSSGTGLPVARILEIAAATVLFIVGLVFQRPLLQTPGSAAYYAVWLAAYLLAGRRVVAAAIRNARNGRFFDENFLMTIATVGAILIRELPEAAGVMLFYSIGEALQDHAVHRSRRSIKALLEIRPDYANVRRGGGIVRVPPAEVQVGEEVVVRPGERIPLDGEVVEGRSSVDTSALTGEPVPRSVGPGDAVLAGTVNTQGLLAIRVAKPFAESSASKVIELVENAGARKGSTEKFITTFSRYYTPAVMLAALGVAVLPPLLLEGAGFGEWVYRALVLLVISCPCALVLSIPLGYFAGIGGAARAGILIKGANFLDALAQLQTVAMDKTGTLTKGVFKVGRIQVFNGVSEGEALEYAAHAESFSSHPVAAAVLEAYGNQVDTSRVGRYEEVPGHGIIAEIDGKPVVVGNDRILHRENIPHDGCTAEGTVVNVAVDGTLVGRIVVGDEIKPDAADAVEALRNLGVERIVMLTGDDGQVARRVAEATGIGEVYAGLLPEEKVAVFERIAREQGPGSGKTAFAGDGINDAPVLARADVGIAMGALGSDAAIEAADVVIMDDSPSRIAKAVSIARRTRQIVVQNVVFALGVKAAFILLGSLGHATMWEAVFADVGVSLIAVLNATRVLRG